MGNKGQVQGLIALIALVGVSGIILMTVYNSVLVNSAFNQNATLLVVQNIFMPLFILAGVAGAVIGVLLLAFGGRR